MRPVDTQRPLALLNARLIDPASAHEGAGGVLVENGLVVAVGAAVTRENLPTDAAVLDCRGGCVAPGLIDMRVLPERTGPGDDVDLARLSASAAAGGVTGLVVAADLDPPIDEPAQLARLRERARDVALARIWPTAAMTQQRNGRALAPFGLLIEAGAVAFSDGPNSLADAATMRRALAYAQQFDAIILGHCEDASLAAGGLLGEGELASRLGLPAIPVEAESIVLARDLQLVALTGARYHAAIVSCRQSLDLIAAAKRRGLRVTCGTTINHLTLNENDAGHGGAPLRFSPPLRAEEERVALVDALATGLIDVVVSDHTPLADEAAASPFDWPPPGAIGLEMLLAAALRLVHAEAIALPALMARLSATPARLLKLPGGRLEAGSPADLVVFDPDEAFLVEAARMTSRSRNTPFDGARMQGRVKATLVGGATVFSATAAD